MDYPQFLCKIFLLVAITLCNVLNSVVDYVPYILCSFQLLNYNGIYNYYIVKYK